MAGRTCEHCGTDLSTFNPAVKRCPECCADVMRAAGLEPLDPYPGAHRPWRCRCVTCGDVVKPRLANVYHKGTGCDSCGRRAGVAARCVPEVEAVAVMLAAGLEPLEPYVNNHTPWRCRCMRCGTEVSPEYNNIKSGWGAAGIAGT